MRAADWLVAYRETSTLVRVLRRLAARLSRSAPLESGLEELLCNYRDLADIFRRFMIEAADFFAGLRLFPHQ
jgi:acyl carrier protein phosphodiesterase